MTGLWGLSMTPDKMVTYVEEEMRNRLNQFVGQKNGKDLQEAVINEAVEVLVPITQPLHYVVCTFTLSPLLSGGWGDWPLGGPHKGP